MAHARQRWASLWARIQAITPSHLMRFTLVSGALTLIGWQIWLNRFALVPFLIGLALAYLSIPLVNGLDRILPRWMAILLTMIGELFLFVFLVSALTVPLVTQLGDLIARLPSRIELRALIDQLTTYIRSLPEPTRLFLQASVEPALEQIRVNLITYLRSLLDLAIASIFGLSNTFGFILSFLIVPTWLFAVLLDQRRGLRALDRHLPTWLRCDFWATLRLIDRPLRAFVGGQVVMGLVVGVTTYLGLQLLERLGGPSTEFALLLAMTAGLLELIPVVGAILYVLVAALAGLTVSPQLAGVLFLVAVSVQILANQLILPHIERRYASNVHPALLAVAVVVISQFGLFWLLLAGPLTAIVVDLFRYAYGRFSDPPRPAGLLPGEPLPAPSSPAAPPVRRQYWPTRTPKASPIGGLPGRTTEKRQ